MNTSMVKSSIIDGWVQPAYRPQRARPSFYPSAIHEAHPARTNLGGSYGPIWEPTASEIG
jgi:hypothetical protein